MRLSVDTSRRLAEEPGSGHNRWHPGLEPIASVRPGTEITFETRDGLDGPFDRSSTHEDVLHVDLRLGHPLTGPVFVETVEPGDLLEIELIAYESSDFGFTA